MSETLSPAELEAVLVKHGFVYVKQSGLYAKPLSKTATLTPAEMLAYVVTSEIASVTVQSESCALSSKVKQEFKISAEFEASLINVMQDTVAAFNVLNARVFK